jgi:hypothetical protein
VKELVLGLVQELVLVQVPEQFVDKLVVHMIHKLAQVLVQELVLEQLVDK